MPIRGMFQLTCDVCGAEHTGPSDEPEGWIVFYMMLERVAPHVRVAVCDVHDAVDLRSIKRALEALRDAGKLSPMSR